MRLIGLEIGFIELAAIALSVAGLRHVGGLGFLASGSTGATSAVLG
jgi:hypothetical protein